MNTIILTKIAKFTLIGSLSAFLAFVGKFNPQLNRFFLYLYAGTLAVILIASLWEGRDLIKTESPEDAIGTLLPGLQGGKPKRQYFLAPNVRLELAIGIIIVTVAALVGAL